MSKENYKEMGKSFLSSKLVKVFRLLNQRIIVIERSTKRIDLLPFSIEVTIKWMRTYICHLQLSYPPFEFTIGESKDRLKIILYLSFYIL